MLLKIIIPLTAIALLAASLIANAQDKRSNSGQQQQDDEAKFAKRFEKYERNLKVTIQAKEQYRLAEPVALDVSLTNVSDETLGTYVMHQFLQESVELRKDGQNVPYRKDRGISPEATVRKFGISDVRTVGVMPQQTKMIRTINLVDWYGPFEPGTYQVTLGHRFWGKGKPIKSNTVTFEVVP